jgi:ribonuclease BN (tRNA processing enzyme)
MSAVGYQITSRDKKSFFFSGDTGRNNPSFWQAVSAQLVIIEVTFPNSHQTLAMESSHLTPQFLKEELGKLKGVRGSLPPVVTVHMNPELEGEIREEVEQVSRELGAEITLGYEGMTIVL